MTQPSDDPATTIRLLRAQLRAAKEEHNDLHQRLDHTLEEVRELRAKAIGNVNQVAMPEDRVERSRRAARPEVPGHPCANCGNSAASTRRGSAPAALHNKTPLHKN